MKHIAALYTCFNRKEKTLKSLETLYKAVNKSTRPISASIYLTDDGSTDGTSEAVSKQFPEVHILKGDGNLFWAKGMHNSWSKALEKNYEGYLLLNDDVEIYNNIFDELIAAHEYSIKTYDKPGIYIGPTENKEEGKLTYSGSLILNKFLYTQKRLTPNGTFQKCDLANANIMLVSNAVVQKIGLLSKEYSHGMADYDYTLTANKYNFPVLITKNYCGHCINDHKDKYEDFGEKTLAERKKILYSPTGLAYDSYLKYMRKFFPLRYPIVAFFGWFKLYFPNTYAKYLRR